MKGVACLLPLLVLVAAGPVFAGGSVAVRVAGPQDAAMEIRWREGNVRIDPEARPAYLLMREGRLYSVSPGRDGALVMDLSAMQGRMRGASRRLAPATGVERVAEVVAMEPAGTEETVAGITGERYRITWTDRDGERHVDEAVLTGHEVLVSLAMAMRDLAEGAAALDGRADPDVLGDRLVSEGLGLLRFGDRYRVMAVSGAEPPAAAFELPAEPLAPPDRQ